MQRKPHQRRASRGRKAGVTSTVWMIATAAAFVLLAGGAWGYVEYRQAQQRAAAATARADELQRAKAELDEKNEALEAKMQELEALRRAEPSNSAEIARLKKELARETAKLREARARWKRDQARAASKWKKEKCYPGSVMCSEID